MAIKSVPPVEVPPISEILIATPLIKPPNILINRISSVIGTAGTISVKILVATIIQLVTTVNFLPIALKLIIAGIAFNAKLIGEKGTVISKNLSQMV